MREHRNSDCWVPQDVLPLLLFEAYVTCYSSGTLSPHDEEKQESGVPGHRFL